MEPAAALASFLEAIADPLPSELQLPAACQSQLRDCGQGTRRLAACHWSWVADLLRYLWGQASLPAHREGWGQNFLSQMQLKMNMISQGNESLGQIVPA